MITLGGKLALGVVLAAELRRLRSVLVPGLLDDGWDVRVGEELRTQVEQLTDEPSGTIVNLRLHDELQGLPGRRVGGFPPMFGAHDYLVGGASVVEGTTHEVVGEGLRVEPCRGGRAGRLRPQG